jgi:hypothetical protein
VPLRAAGAGARGAAGAQRRARAGQHRTARQRREGRKSL